MEGQGWILRAQSSDCSDRSWESGWWPKPEQTAGVCCVSTRLRNERGICQIDPESQDLPGLGWRQACRAWPSVAALSSLSRYSSSTPTTGSDDGEQQVLPPEAPPDWCSPLYSAIQLFHHVLAGSCKIQTGSPLPQPCPFPSPSSTLHPGSDSKAPAGWHHSLASNL